MSPGWFKKKGKKADSVAEKSAPGKTLAPPAKAGGPGVPAGGPPAAKAAKASPVRVSNLLTEDLVMVRPAQAEKGALLDALVHKLCAVRGILDPDRMLQKVLERENGVFTTLDTGLSLPHARVDGLKDIAAILAVLPQGITDNKQAEFPIRAMFLFLSPNPTSSGPPDALARHLQLLRSVSALFQPEVIEALAGADSPAKVLELIRTKESA